MIIQGLGCLFVEDLGPYLLISSEKPGPHLLISPELLPGAPPSYFTRASSRGPTFLFHPRSRGLTFLFHTRWRGPPCKNPQNPPRSGGPHMPCLNINSSGGPIWQKTDGTWAGPRRALAYFKSCAIDLECSAAANLIPSCHWPFWDLLFSDYSLSC